MSTTRGLVTVRKNSGVDQGTVERLNFIEGSNIVLTINHDAANDEMDIEIDASGGGSGGDVSIYYPVQFPDSYLGDHPAAAMPQTIDNEVRQSIMIPKDVVTLDKVYVLISAPPYGSANRNMVWGVDTDFGAISGGEDYDQHTDSTSGTATLGNDDIEYIDIIAAFTSATANDLVGVKFKRTGSSGSDTLEGNAYYFGIYVEGSSS
jgi:hypothetical protein